jgi:hypothetical protein
MSYTDTTTRQELTEDKEQLKELSKGPIMVKKKNQLMTITRSLHQVTFKRHLILSLALTIPIHKDVSHKCHVAIFGYKI